MILCKVAAPALALIWMLSFPTPTGMANPSPSPPRKLVLDTALAEATKLSRLHSLLVSVRGEIVLEQYFNGTKPVRLANMKSASKSVISALVGIAIDRGKIPSVQQPISAYFPELLKNEKDPLKRQITIEDLLTMRSGLESTSNRNYGAWVLSSNWVRHALTRPMLSAPGSTMIYSTGNTHLLSAILTKGTGKSTWQFAQETLARPMGFSLAQWPRDPQGIYFGGNDMTMTPRQMLAFGQMYLRGGKVNETQVVPAKWIETSLTARTVSRRESDRFYGYGWWVRELAGQETFYAWGYGGQFIFLVPSLDLVVTVTSDSEPGAERRSHLGAIYGIVEDVIIPEVAAVAENDSSFAIGKQ
jgi:CubicO group peptidase (beta-lactamase class C family)